VGLNDAPNRPVTPRRLPPPACHSSDLGVRYHGNGEVEYLKEGDIQDNPDGTITITPTRSEANLLTFQIGVQIGTRAGGSQF
jgi:hypothetical protein